MKFKIKTIGLLAVIAAAVWCLPAGAQGLQPAPAAAPVVPPWLCIPFACMLLCVAVLPLVCPYWWEEHRLPVVALLCLLFIVPFGALNGAFTAAETVLDCIVNDYLTFIVLLFGLFCVSGNITLDGDLAGSPRVNTGLLLFGTLLASCIGTTGASMLMVRPLIKMNAWRHRKRHIIIFFILMVSNMGGCLTPIGDPPLLMGFMRGIPFFWSLHLAPVLLLNCAILLTVFYRIDMRAYRKDIAQGRKPNISGAGNFINLVGAHNILFLLLIVGAVILSGILPGLPLFCDAQGRVKGIHLLGEVTLTWPAIIEMALILTAAFLSFRTTHRAIRVANHFNWGAIREVAELFVGIFITMQPALMILKNLGPTLGLSTPFALFWSTGLLSSFLDNTPTYLVFLTTAGTLGFTQGVATALGTVPLRILSAISCGAVFMGACTYIGNAPNFMVKTIAEENGIQMPSFFAYLLWPLCILMPVFLLDSLIFFM